MPKHTCEIFVQVSCLHRRQALAVSVGVVNVGYGASVVLALSSPGGPFQFGLKLVVDHVDDEFVIVRPNQIIRVQMQANDRVPRPFAYPVLTH